MYPDIAPETIVNLLVELDTDGDYKIDKREFKEKDIEGKFKKASEEAAQRKAKSGSGFNSRFN